MSESVDLFSEFLAQIRRSTGTTPATIEDDVSITANVGIGGEFFVSEAIHIRVEGKLRYIDALVDELDDSLGIFEATVGVGWVF